MNGMYGLIYLSLGAVSQASSSITYSCPANSIGAVFKDLSRMSGKNIVAGEGMGDEILFVSVTGLSFEKLLTQIGVATSGAWKISGDTYSLQPDKSIREKEERQELQKSAEKLKRVIAKFVKESQSKAGKPVAKPDPDDPATVGDSDDPGERAIYKLLESLDPAVLASLRNSRRLVWATNNATGMQGSLPDGSGEVITTWIEEHNKSVATSTGEAMPVPDLGDPNLNAEVQSQIRMAADRVAPVNERVAKALLIAQSSRLGAMGGGGGIEIQLKAFNSKGKLLLSATTNVDGDEEDPTSDENPKAVNSVDSFPPFQPSPMSQQVSKIWSPGPGKIPGLFKLPPEISQKLARPDQVDPLSLLPSDLVSYYAKTRHKQVVADLPDDMFGHGAIGFGVPQEIKKGKDALQAVEDGSTLSVAVDGDVATIRPAKPSENRLNRVSRKSLTALISEANTQGYLTLNDISSYALGNGPFENNAIAVTYAMIYFPSAMTTGMGPLVSWNAYRFYGTLNEDQRSTLMSGGQETLLTLSSDQVSAAADYLFSSEAQFGGNDPTPHVEGSPLGEFAEMAGSVMQNMGDSDIEPTEVMPNGLEKSLITESTRKEQVVSFAPGMGPMDLFCMSPSEYGMMKAFSASNIMDSSNFTMPSEGRLGERQHLEIVFHLTPTIGAHCRLTDLYFAKDSGYMALDKLPTEFLAKANSAADQIKKFTTQIGKIGQKPATP